MTSSPANSIVGTSTLVAAVPDHSSASHLQRTVADEIITLHGGYLKIDSTEKIGTIVTISIPTAAKLENDKRMMTN